MKKFGFYVSGNASTLKKFIKRYEDNKLVGQIEIVISDNPNDEILTNILKVLDINVVYFDISKYEKNQRNIELSNFILNEFIKYDINFGFIFGGKILKGPILQNYKNKLINFHPAILPSFKGLKAIDQALKAKAFLFGNSAHLVVEDVDSGSIIMQNILHKSRFDDYASILDNQINMLYQIILWINEERLLINDDQVIIKNADYSISEYIPRLEF